MAHLHVREHVRELCAQELHDSVGLAAAFENQVRPPASGSSGVSKVRDVRERGAFAGKCEQKTVMTDETVVCAALSQSPIDFLVIDLGDARLRRGPRE